MGFNRAVRQEVQGLVRCWRAEVGDGVVHRHSRPLERHRGGQGGGFHAEI